LLLVTAHPSQAQFGEQFSFNAPVTYSVGEFPEAGAAADFNGDGFLDLAVTTNGAKPSIVFMFNNGHNEFTFAGEYLSPHDAPMGQIITADWNGDGLSDLAISLPTLDRVLLLNNSGFRNQYKFIQSAMLVVGDMPGGLAAGDLNGDGRMDLVVANSGSHDINVFFNRGIKWFSAYRLQTGQQPLHVALGDINGDGTLDLAVTNYKAKTVSMYYNKTTGFKVGPVFSITPFEPDGLVLNDFNNDGFADLAIAANARNGEASRVIVFRNQRGFWMQPLFVDTLSFGTCGIVAADFNEDGVSELLTADEGSSQLTLLAINARGMFAPAYRFSVIDGPEHLIAADLDGDGDVDVVSINSAGKSISVIENAIMR
jgi:hypothetical protein